MTDRRGLVERLGFWVDDGTIRYVEGGCRSATDAEIAMFAALSPAQPDGAQAVAIVCIHNGERIATLLKPLPIGVELYERQSEQATDLPAMHAEPRLDVLPEAHNQCQLTALAAFEAAARICDQMAKRSERDLHGSVRCAAAIRAQAASMAKGKS